MSADLPPTYTQEPPETETDIQVSDDSDQSFVSAPDGVDDADASRGTSPAPNAAPQILIIPVADGGVHFQKGYLGADGERAAIEGEMQIKSGDADLKWRKISVSLRSVEKAHEKEIELANTEIVLGGDATPGPQQRSSFPFSIPLPSDTPQCIHTYRSSIAHTLTATVWPKEGDAPPLSRSLLVHTRRYTSHTYVLHPTPETWVITQPSRVEVQLPRTTFKAGEPIPIYITVPTPSADFVVEQGMRLRNLRAELVRVINVKRDETESGEISDAEFESYQVTDPGDEQSTLPSQKTNPAPSTSRQGRDFAVRRGEHGERKVVALSGASCRLHPSRPIRVRLVLHQSTGSPLMDTLHEQQPSDESHSLETGTECASITQSTLLHDVSFRLLVHATFMNMSNHTERVSTTSIPLLILASSSALPEVEPSVDAAYIKKHDRPPTRTVRLEDTEVPQYDVGGPSAIAGAPPPFEEREAPPPFAEASTSSRPPTFHESEASTSRLPTFLESERELYVPHAADSDPDNSDPDDPISLPPAPAFDGEGTLFGFRAADQFDGYADVLAPRAFTPPPPLELAARDADVTRLANMDLNGGAIEALGLALEQQSLSIADALPPPPPPPMDDPSDPPPSIDSPEFRAPGAQHAHDSPPRAQSPPHGVIPPHPLDEGEAHGHAPPPYRVPGSDHDHDHDDHGRVVHPPPYMDLVHENH